MTAPVLRAEKLSKTFGDTTRRRFVHAPGQPVHAVDGVSFEIGHAETLALVGESGCGKSTLGRLLLRLVEPSAGRVFFEGADLMAMDRRQVRRMRARFQMIFQDPYSSLSPRRSIGDIVAEPMDVFGMVKRGPRRRDRIAELLTQVGLSPAVMDRFPRQFSGGQRQRIGIARAISVNPGFIVADEPVSALDVSVQAQVVNLMQDLQRAHGFSYLFIAHDLAVVRHIADRVAVMYLGRIVEIGLKREIYAAPHHPYTEALLSAAPQPDPDRRTRRIILPGDVPSPTCIPPGCNFHTRCPLVQDICRNERPILRNVTASHTVACHFAQPRPIATQAFTTPPACPDSR